MTPISSESDVAELLITRALTRTERVATTSAALQDLAAAILDSPEAGIAASDIPVLEQQELLNTRLVFEDGNLFRIPLRVVAERAASQWLAVQPVEIALAKAQAGDSSDRWRTSLTDYLRALSDEAAVSFVVTVAVRDPVIATQLARADKTPRSVSWNVATLQQAIDEAETILASAFPRLYAASPSRPHVQDNNGDYTIKRDILAADGRPKSRTTSAGHSWVERQSAFLFAMQHLVRLIDDCLGARSFTVSDPTLDEEELWNLARVLLSLGTLEDKPIALDTIEERLARLPEGIVMAQGRDRGHHLVPADTDRLRVRVAALRLSGVATWAPPFVPGDQTAGPGVWSTYSDENLLRKRRETMFNAMRAYWAIVDRWLPALRPRMQKCLLLPALFRERVGRGNSNEPVFSQYWVPLASNAESRVDITSPRVKMRRYQ
jgi:hypothetical protein